MTTHIPRVVLFGRANVGKSTLFNRLVESRKALTSSVAGTTRDVNRSLFSWQGAYYELYDTGGIESIVPQKKLKSMAPPANEDFAAAIIEQTQRTLKRANVILFVVDAKTGLLPHDRLLAKQLHALLKSMGKKTPVMVLANKTSTKTDRSRAAECTALGFGNAYPLAALTGVGIGDMLDALTTIVPGHDMPAEQEKPTTIAIIGKPNVGKSSLLNSIMGEENAIVSPLPHTTREPNDFSLVLDDQSFVIIDTAGIRRRSNTAAQLEQASVKKTLATLKRADVCLLILDINQPITQQDKALSSLIVDAGVSVMIVANKWDLIEEKDTKRYEEYIYRVFPFLAWAPIMFVSAKKNIRTKKLLTAAHAIADARHMAISDGSLEKFLKYTIKGHHPQSSKGYRKTPYLKSLEQVDSNPPRFRLTLNRGDSLQPQYVTFIANRLREQYGIIGTPIIITVA